MEDTPRNLVRHLSDLRRRLSTARTADEMIGTLADGLVPSWADGLRIVVRGAEQPALSVGSSGGQSGWDPFPAELPSASTDSTIWLCVDPAKSAESAVWTAIDLVESPSDLPAYHHAAIGIDGFGEPAAIVLYRAPGRGPWTIPELSAVSESVRLIEFVLTTVQQHRRTLEARSAADAASHRWANFARLSRCLVRSVDFGDVASAIVSAMVPYLADWALLDLVTPNGGVERMGSRHALPARQELLELIRTFPFGPDTPLAGLSRMDDEGSLFPQVGPDDLRRLAGPNEHSALEALSPQSVAIVPLIVGDQLRGALTLATSAAGQRYGGEDFALFRSLADQAALALNSAQLYRDARRARMEREEVLAIVSHDLKNPLHTLAFAQTILAQEGISEEAKTLQFGIMERALGQMNALVRDLLDTARIDAGRFSVSPSPQDATELVREAVLHSAPLASQAQVRLEHSEMHDVLTVLADRDRIMQVFGNLLDNAISHTPANGYVRVSARGREESVVFEVADSGPGLDRAAAEHVFDRFWQARQTGRAGAGLGLAIARGIVEAHGGEIGVRSVPGQGAVFHFSIPSPRV